MIARFINQVVDWVLDRGAIPLMAGVVIIGGALAIRGCAG